MLADLSRTSLTGGSSEHSCMVLKLGPALLLMDIKHCTQVDTTAIANQQYHV